MIDQNAPARPWEDHNHRGNLIRYPGLTIRAEFAARAMQAMAKNLSISTEHSQAHDMKRIAELAVCQADAIISALNEKTKETA